MNTAPEIPRPIYAQPEMVKFLLVAEADGAFEKVLKNKQPEKRVRDIDILRKYYWTEHSAEKIGGVFDLTREGVRQIIKKGIGDVYEALTPELRAALLPLPELLAQVGKPKTLTMRMDLSTERGGKSIRVEKLVKAGRTPAQIREILGLSGQGLDSARRTLMGWGKMYPKYENRSPVENKQLAQALRDKSETKEERAALLSQVNHSFIHMDTSSGNRSIIPVSYALRRAGYHIPTTEIESIIAVLEERGVSVGILRKEIKTLKGKIIIQRYIFIAAGDLEQALQVFRKAESLQKYLRNPVSQTAGPLDENPPSLQRGYKTVGSLLREYEIRRKWSQRVNLGGSPVPVFRRGASYFYPADQEGAFRKFIESQLGR